VGQGPLLVGGVIGLIGNESGMELGNAFFADRSFGLGAPGRLADQHVEVGASHLIHRIADGREMSDGGKVVAADFGRHCGDTPQGEKGIGSQGEAEAADEAKGHRELAGQGETVEFRHFACCLSLAARAKLSMQFRPLDGTLRNSPHRQR
jgi:hypothetical protein